MVNIKKFKFKSNKFIIGDVVYVKPGIILSEVSALHIIIPNTPAIITNIWHIGKHRNIMIYMFCKSMLTRSILSRHFTAKDNELEKRTVPPNDSNTIDSLLDNLK